MYFHFLGSVFCIFTAWIFSCREVPTVWWLLGGRHSFLLEFSQGRWWLQSWWLWHPFVTDTARNIPFLSICIICNTYIGMCVYICVCVCVCMYLLIILAYALKTWWKKELVVSKECKVTPTLHLFPVIRLKGKVSQVGTIYSRCLEHRYRSKMPLNPITVMCDFNA